MSDFAEAANRNLQWPAGLASTRLHHLGMQLRADVGAVTDPRIRTLFVTTADLLTTLGQAFADAETGIGLTSHS